MLFSVGREEPEPWPGEPHGQTEEEHGRQPPRNVQEMGPKQIILLAFLCLISRGAIQGLLIVRPLDT